jgi:hypothetical protein
MLLTVATVSAAQSVPATVEAAEAEGSSFPHGAWPAAVSSLFAQPFSGSAERKCVTPPSTDDSVRNGSLRSGDLIVRARLTGRWGLRANRAHKILWMPLHNPVEHPETLVIRAARVGHPADSLRQVLPHGGAWSGSKTNSGFPSGMTFPTAGEWLVVATAGNDWGCFLLTIANSA